jgi:hypothetical protein
VRLGALFFVVAWAGRFVSFGRETRRLTSPEAKAFLQDAFSQNTGSL